MGTNWLLEVISLIKDNAGVTSGWLFRIIDYFNAAIGVVLFLVLVCKPRVIKLLISKIMMSILKRNESLSCTGVLKVTTGSGFKTKSSGCADKSSG